MNDEIPVVGFTIFGERCSGTNLVQYLFNTYTNLIDVQIYGEKHGPAKFDVGSKSHLFIICVRNPFDWSCSLFRKPHHAAGHILGLEYSDFIRSEWHSVTQARDHTLKKFGKTGRLGAVGMPLLMDVHPLDSRYYRNIFEMRQVKYKQWLSLGRLGLNLVLIRLENIRNRPREILKRISDRFDFELNDGFQSDKDCLLPSKRLGFGHSLKNRVLSNGGRPLKEPNDISELDRAFILDQLSTDLEAKLGYQINKHPGIEFN